MATDESKITDTQFLCSVMCFVQSSSLLTAFLASLTEHDSWLVALLAMLFCLPLLWIYRALILRFPHRNLFQIHDDVYGKVVGTFLNVVYVWFFMTLTALNLTDLGEFAKLTLMTDTPSLVLVVMCVAVSSIAVRHRDGLRVVTAYNSLFVVIALLILGTSIVLVLNQADLRNFLPVLDRPFPKTVQGIHVMTAIPFGEIVTFLMITPSVLPSRHQTVKGLFVGFILGGLTLVVVLMRDISVLGNTLSIFTLPSLVTLRLVNVGMALSRMEILFAVVLIMLLFSKITFLYHVSVAAIAHVMKVKAYWRIALVTGALIIAYGLTLYPSPIERIATAQRTIPFFWTFLELGIPLITLVVATLRKLPRVMPKNEV